MKIYDVEIIGSNSLTGSISNTGSQSDYTGSFKGDVYGTASWAHHAGTASYFVGFFDSSSYSQYAVSSSYALSASWAPGSTSISSSYSVSSSYSDFALSASWAPGSNNISSSYSVSSSYSDFALSASYAPTPLTSSYALTASHIEGQFYAKYTQSPASTTWSFQHNLNYQYPLIGVWNDDNEVIIPEKIYAYSMTQAYIYFPVPVSGFAVATVGSILPTDLTSASYAQSSSYSANASHADNSSYSISSSYALSASYAPPFPTSSYAVTASHAILADSASYVLNYFTTITRAQAETLVSGSGLTVGATYKITGCHTTAWHVGNGTTITTLYNDGTDSGITLYLKAAATNQFEREGYGEFWNPRYDQTNYGNVVSGSICLYNIWDGDNPDLDALPTYSIGQKVIWGGYVWQNLTGILGFNNSVTDLNEDDWLKMTYNSTDYAKIYDYIEYDFANNWICRRRHAEPVIDVIFPFQFWNSSVIPVEFSVSKHGIAVMQWGNKYNKDTGLGVGLSTIIDSYFDCINFKGNRLLGAYLNNYSWDQGCYRGLNTVFEGLILDNYSYQKNCNFETSAYQKYIILKNYSYQQDLKITTNAGQLNVIMLNRNYQRPSSPGTTLFNSGSYQNGIQLNNGAYIAGVSLINGSFQGSMTFDNGSYMDSILLDNSIQSNFQLQDSCLLFEVKLLNSVQYYFFLNQAQLTGEFTGSSQYNVRIVDYTPNYGVVSGSTEQYTYWGCRTAEFNIEKTFNNTTGSGVVGSITIPTLPVPTNYYIEEVNLTSTNLSGSAAASITLGIQTDNISSGINYEGGLISSLTPTSSAAARYSLLPCTVATSDRILVMNTSGSNILGGTAHLNIKLRKGK